MIAGFEELNPEIIQSIRDIKSTDICGILEGCDLIYDALDCNEKNILFYAIEFQNIDAIKFLIEKLKLDHKDNKGNTALHIAVSLGNLEIIKLLLAKEIDPNLKNKEGDTAIFNVLFSSNKDNSLEIIKVLKQHGANVDEENNKGLSPILIAISNIDRKIASYLAKLGAKTDFLNEESLEKILSDIISSSMAKEESKQKMLELISEIKSQQKQSKILSPSLIETPSTTISVEEFKSISRESSQEL